jgi:hypothetical protein
MHITCNDYRNYPLTPWLSAGDGAPRRPRTPGTQCHRRWRLPFCRRDPAAAAGAAVPARRLHPPARHSSYVHRRVRCQTRCSAAHSTKQHHSDNGGPRRLIHLGVCSNICQCHNCRQRPADMHCICSAPNLCSVPWCNYLIPSQLGPLDGSAGRSSRPGASSVACRLCRITPLTLSCAMPRILRLHPASIECRICLFGFCRTFSYNSSREQRFSRRVGRECCSVEARAAVGSAASSSEGSIKSKAERIQRRGIHVTATRWFRRVVCACAGGASHWETNWSAGVLVLIHIAQLNELQIGAGVVIWRTLYLIRRLTYSGSIASLLSSRLC